MANMLRHANMHAIHKDIAAPKLRLAVPGEGLLVLRPQSLVLELLRRSYHLAQHDACALQLVALYIYARAGNTLVLYARRACHRPWRQRR
eukprot:361917-Chlamydomonas_euryale.AAC.12